MFGILTVQISHKNFYVRNMNTGNSETKLLFRIAAEYRFEPLSVCHLVTVIHIHMNLKYTNKC